MLDTPIKLTTTGFGTDYAEITIQYLNDELGDANQTQLRVKASEPISIDDNDHASCREVVSNQSTSCTLRLTIHSPRFWSPETPSLYKLEIKVTRPYEMAKVFTLSWGIKALQIDRSFFVLNGSQHLLRGVRLTQLLTEELATRLRRFHINTLIVPLEVSPSMQKLPELADSFGFHVLYEVSIDDENLLWYAENNLFSHVSTLGWVLPQASMHNAQLWHNAMLHLHRQRRDVFVGILVDSLPLSMVQGHVEFILVPMNQIEELDNVTMPRLALVRRFDLMPSTFSTNLAGCVSRLLPQE